ncbi:MAG: hypothetical protein ACLQU2_15150 [Candidatus Binataceae bacterium]
MTKFLARMIALTALALSVGLGACNSFPANSEAASQGTAVIFGRVLSGQGMASPNMPTPSGMPGIKVTLADVSGTHVIATVITTGGDGSFSFTVAPGDYSVSAVGNPHLVHVDAGQKIQVDLYLPTP